MYVERKKIKGSYQKFYGIVGGKCNEI